MPDACAISPSNVVTVLLPLEPVIAATGAATSWAIDFDMPIADWQYRDLLSVIKAEIEIIKLVGGTDAFIRRPFLYEGLWYGLLGALIALTLVLAALYLLDGPVQRLAGLYESSFSLSVLDPLSLLGVAIGGPALGLAGAWLAVGRHLAQIQPE